MAVIGGESRHHPGATSVTAPPAPTTVAPAVAAPSRHLATAPAPAPVRATNPPFAGVEPTPSSGLPPVPELTEVVFDSVTEVSQTLQAVFEQWWLASGSKKSKDRGLHLDRADLFDAFVAGYQFAVNAVKDRRPVPELEGTVEQRTILAALEFFIDQILVHGSEEIASGAWLDAEAARGLAARIRAGEPYDR